ncbi:MAG: 4-hydroxythreonine-4-phosphate dehydrogenase PdxA, partial [Candidatus Electrothrix sp. EH2]|nr:4-hydroxythreonine-4-phosphate dehydrogenase PdxA [Candidatus Electrothrix sp. EH2]
MKPIAVTMGCPVGVGPEIILRFFETLESNTAFPPVVLGDLAVLSRTAAQLRCQVEPVYWRSGNEIRPGTVPVLELSHLNAHELRWGKPTPETGAAMAKYIHNAVQQTQHGNFAAMVT